MSSTKKVGIALLLVGLAFWFPLTRALILFILPLGSGVDDLVFIVALGLGLSILALNRAHNMDDWTRSRWVFTVVLVSVLAVVGIILSMLL